MLDANVWHVGTLSASERDKLCRCVHVFIDEKNWEGCAGLNVTDEMRVAIAGQACLLVLGFDDFLFEHVETILIYPSEYQARDRRFQPQEVEERVGEAHLRGPVVLSWEDALAGGRGESEGANVVLHEFAHQLDMLEGEADGIPPIGDRRQLARWRSVMGREYAALCKRSRRGRASILDAYGAESEAEFFAVATEAFFEDAQRLRSRHKRLYKVLVEWYRQDPAARHDAMGQKRPDSGP